MLIQSKRTTISCLLALLGVALLIYGAFFRTIAVSVKGEEGVTIVAASEPALMKAISTACPT